MWAHTPLHAWRQRCRGKAILLPGVFLNPTQPHFLKKGLSELEPGWWPVSPRDLPVFPINGGVGLQVCAGPNPDFYGGAGELRDYQALLPPEPSSQVRCATL